MAWRKEIAAKTNPKYGRISGLEPLILKKILK